MVQNHGNQNNASKALSLCGIIAPILFAILVVVGGLFYKGYSHATYAVSELGGVTARYPLIQNANFFVVGVLIMAFAVGLHRGLTDGRGSKVGPVLLGIFGALTVVQAFLPLDPGGEWETATGSLHNVAGLGGFLAAISGIFAISRRLKGGNAWQSHRRYSIITGVAALAGLIAWIMISKGAGIESVNGVLQRIFIGLILLWIGVMGTRLFKISRLSLR